MKENKLYINGKWLNSSSGNTFKSYDKSTGEVINEFVTADADDVRAACAAARNAFESGVWSELDPKVRAEYMLKVADGIRKRYDEFAEVEAREAGKPINDTTVFDIEVSIWALEYFANKQREVKGDVIPLGDFSNRAFNFVCYEPYGVAGIIAPYNFPLHLVTRSLAPALAAGNAVVVKAPEVAPSTTAMLAEVFAEAGVPAGVFNVVAGGSIVGRALVGDREVDIVSFTGSEAVGRELMHNSAKSPVIKKLLLELGGKGPGVVFSDADLEIATDSQVQGFTHNAGQVCCAITRCIVHESIYDNYISLLKKKIESLRIGPLLDPKTQMGCLISESHLNKVDALVQGVRNEGANVICGGERYLEGDCAKGPYYKPTIITDVTTDMKIWSDEVFGPVLSVIKFKTDDEAVLLANDTCYGLGANVFTEDLKKAYWISKKLNAGCLWVNLPQGMDMGTPFGGNKNSGMGREYGDYALREYLKIKNNMWRMK